MCPRAAGPAKHCPWEPLCCLEELPPAPACPEHTAGARCGPERVGRREKVATGRGRGRIGAVSATFLTRAWTLRETAVRATRRH